MIARFVKDFSWRNWADWVVIAYILGLVGLVIWSVIFVGNSDGFWTLLLISVLLVWLGYRAGYEKGHEKGRKEDFIKNGSEHEDISRVLSFVYLHKKKRALPSREEVATEMGRRERWLGLTLDSREGREAFEKAKETIYKDPPEDFM